MRLRHIEIFQAIRQTGSVSAAAQLLHVSQPAVTKVLQHAELQLGFPLFLRVRGKLQPTPEALALEREVEQRVFVGAREHEAIGAALGQRLRQLAV